MEIISVSEHQNIKNADIIINGAHTKYQERIAAFVSLSVSKTKNSVVKNCTILNFAIIV